jgi:hypothetical protein
MDLLSIVGSATKRREDYFTQAERLAKKFPTEQKLEQQMAEESKVLVKGLHGKMFRFEEYERSLVDKTLISALAAVHLGAQKSRPKDKMKKAWPVIVGNMLPPLTKFLAETKTYVENKTLLQGDSSLDFEELNLQLLEELESQGEKEAEEKGAIGQTWPALYGRVQRYLSTPVYSNFHLGEYYVKEEQGFREMRRNPRSDQKVCIDCSEYGERGWVPLGNVPLPGQECRCYDRCRCTVEYR